MRSFLLLVVVAGCVEQPMTSETTADVESSNRLSSNALAANQFLLASLAADGLTSSNEQLTALVDDATGQEQLKYLVSCAIAANKFVTATGSDGTAYTFPGALGLADSWRDHAPTATDRRWVSACMLARTNYFHVAVPLSLRGTFGKLATTANEKTGFIEVEGAFWGDLFAVPQTAAACASPLALSIPDVSTFPLRVCTLSDDGITTRCGFTYAGDCTTACVVDKGTGIYKTCGAAKEVITSFLAAP